MLEREVAMGVLWSRLASVTGVAYTARNPKAEPGADNMPAIQFFELDDKPEPAQSRGGRRSYPAYKRKLRVVIEAFVAGETEASASSDLAAFIIELKKKLYQNGNVLVPDNAFFEEVDGSRMLRPPTGQNIIGIGIFLDVNYIEDTGKLFA